MDRKLCIYPQIEPYVAVYLNDKYLNRDTYDEDATSFDSLVIYEMADGSVVSVYQTKTMRVFRGGK